MTTEPKATETMEPVPSAPPHRAAESALHQDAPAPRFLIPMLVVAAFGLYLASLTPTIITLAIRIAGLDPTGKTVALSTVVLIGAVVTIAALPVCGALSDRTRSRFGRRRPWLVGGSVLGLIGLFLAGAVPSVTAVSSASPSPRWATRPRSPASCR
jgi:MFS family permease